MGLGPGRRNTRGASGKEPNPVPVSATLRRQRGLERFKSILRVAPDPTGAWNGPKGVRFRTGRKVGVGGSRASARS